jgi:hypothetical protein
MRCPFLAMRCPFLAMCTERFVDVARVVVVKDRR